MAWIELKKYFLNKTIRANDVCASVIVCKKTSWKKRIEKKIILSAVVDYTETFCTCVCCRRGSDGLKKIYIQIHIYIYIWTNCKTLSPTHTLRLTHQKRRVLSFIQCVDVSSMVFPHFWTKSTRRTSFYTWTYTRTYCIHSRYYITIFFIYFFFLLLLSSPYILALIENLY